jgi:hypothetical protein
LLNKHSWGSDIFFLQIKNRVVKDEEHIPEISDMYPRIALVFNNNLLKISTENGVSLFPLYCQCDWGG